jgi:hypothetical protein
VRVWKRAFRSRVSWRDLEGMEYRIVNKCMREDSEAFWSSNPECGFQVLGPSPMMSVIISLGVAFDRT